MALRCRCTLLLESPVRSARLRMLCWPYARIALKMTILLAHNPMVSVRALKGGCNWKNQLFRVRDRPPVVPLYVDAPKLDGKKELTRAVYAVKWAKSPHATFFWPGAPHSPNRSATAERNPAPSAIRV